MDIPVKPPPTLFDACVSHILSSLEMCDMSSRRLPKKVAHYLMYVAIERLRRGETNSDFIVHKLIEKWPHQELSFNFRSNPMVVNKTLEVRDCVEPHDYFGLRGVSKTRLSISLKDVAVGLFNHVYHGDRQGEIQLTSVDLRDVQMSGISNSWDPSK